MSQQVVPGTLPRPAPAAKPGLVIDARGPARRVVYFAFAVAMPITFVGNDVGGFRASGWAWLLNLLAIAPLVLTGPLPVRAVRYLLPLLAFLAYCLLSLAWVEDPMKGLLAFLQLAVPAMAYLLAWRASDRIDEVLDRLAQICLLALGLIAATTANTRSWRRTALVGAAVALIAVMTGSRMSSLVLAILLLCSPSLAVSLRWRVLAAAVLVLLLVGFSQTQAFKERFFFDSEATLTDVLTLSPKLNTAGRREAWPLLIETCSQSPVTGLGVGAVYQITFDLFGGGFGQPHNDYIRTYCEAGLAGSILFWGFFLAAGVRSARLAARAPERPLHAAAGLVVLAFLLFALTDNPMVYTAHFMTPMAIVLGLSDATYHATYQRERADRRRRSARARRTLVPAPTSLLPQ
jgi:O-Antigen ligase